MLQLKSKQLLIETLDNTQKIDFNKQKIAVMTRREGYTKRSMFLFSLALVDKIGLVGFAVFTDEPLV